MNVYSMLSDESECEEDETETEKVIAEPAVAVAAPVPVPVPPLYRPPHRVAVMTFPQRYLEPDAYIMGAGMIPYTKRNDKVYFLLGKERKENGWHDSEKWASFGGKRDRGNSVEQTAIYEFFEETAGVVVGLRELRQMVYRGQYTCVLDTPVDERRAFRTYLFRVHRMEDYNAAFQRQREFLDFVGCKNRHCREKTRLQWFPARQLYNVAKDCWNFERDGPQPQFREAFLVTLQLLVQKYDLRQLP